MLWQQCRRIVWSKVTEKNAKKRSKTVHIKEIFCSCFFLIICFCHVVSSLSMFIDLFVCVRVLFVHESNYIWGGGQIKNWNVMQQNVLKEHMYNYFKAFLIKYARKWKTLEFSCHLFIHSFIIIHTKIVDVLLFLFVMAVDVISYCIRGEKKLIFYLNEIA